MNSEIGRRVCVVGCCGAGKSHLSMRLAKSARLPVVHLDRLYWKPGWTPCSNEEMDEKLAREVAKDSWIIDGNFQRTLEARFARATCVIYLDYGRVACELGVIRRVLRHLGRERADMGEGCPERFDWDFLKYVWHFKERNDSHIRGLLAACEKRGVKVIILHSRAQTRRWLKSL